MSHFTLPGALGNVTSGKLVVLGVSPADSSFHVTVHELGWPSPSLAILGTSATVIKVGCDFCPVLLAQATQLATSSVLESSADPRSMVVTPIQPKTHGSPMFPARFLLEILVGSGRKLGLFQFLLRALGTSNKALFHPYPATVPPVHAATVPTVHAATGLPLAPNSSHSKNSKWRSGHKGPSAFAFPLGLFSLSFHSGTSSWSSEASTRA